MAESGLGLTCSCPRLPVKMFPCRMSSFMLCLLLYPWSLAAEFVTFCGSGGFERRPTLVKVGRLGAKGLKGELVWLVEVSPELKRGAEVGVVLRTSWSGAGLAIELAASCGSGELGCECVRLWCGRR
ncbi:hypothetical protein BKA80DRAFT_271169 [Phyllosticta citrichinensis]